MNGDDTNPAIANLTNIANTSQLAIRFAPLIPNGPEFYDFPGQATYNAINQGFVGAWDLALARLKLAWCKPSDFHDMPKTFTRHFNRGGDEGEVVRPTAVNFLTAVLGPMGLGPSSLTSDLQFRLEVLDRF